MKSLEKYVRTRAKNLRKCLTAYSESGTDETIHDIRVEIKKLKAVLQLAGSARPRFNAHKVFVPLRDIFRKAAAIREKDVAIKLAKLHKLKATGKRSESGQQSAKEIFEFDIPAFIKHVKQQEKKILKEIAKISRKEFTAALSKQLKITKKVLYPNVIVKKLHKTRKGIKEVLYLSDVRPVISEEQRKFLEEMAGFIGDLHDKQSMMSTVTAEDRVKLETEVQKDIDRIAARARSFYEKRDWPLM
ncbi:MAG TPA: CHAD domain-containing protein [Cyclobacteriaceae bacterium]|nr:CHAD domain-containing protein [Cyclobacteriaceae bacterium]